MYLARAVFVAAMLGLWLWTAPAQLLHAYRTGVIRVGGRGSPARDVLFAHEPELYVWAFALLASIGSVFLAIVVWNLRQYRRTK
jgi:hypothetical protein